MFNPYDKDFIDNFIDNWFRTIIIFALGGPVLSGATGHIMFVYILCGLAGLMAVLPFLWILYIGIRVKYDANYKPPKFLIYLAEEARRRVKEDKERP